MIPERRPWCRPSSLTPLALTLSCTLIDVVLVGEIDEVEVELREHRRRQDVTAAANWRPKMPRRIGPTERRPVGALEIGVGPVVGPIGRADRRRRAWRLSSWRW